jgi:P2 family phage contractile tail tube protein
MIPHVLKGFNLVIDGIGFAGEVEEITLPKLTVKTEEYRSGGMDAPIELDMGLEKLECEITLTGYNGLVLRNFGFNNPIPTAITVRGVLSNDRGSTVSVVINMRARIKELDSGTWKTGDKPQIKMKLSVFYYRLNHNGQDIIEIDPENFVRKVNGFDQLAALRKSIGV